MNRFADKHIAVFHSGALGDFVLIWPLLRALRAVAAEVYIIAAPSHAELAATELHLQSRSTEQRWCTALWSDASPPPDSQSPRADIVISFTGDPTDPRGQRWCQNARRALGAGDAICVGPPDSPSRAELWVAAQVATLGSAPPRSNLAGPILLHTGAGSRAKMWPMQHWRDLAGLLHDHGRTPQLIAGHVERERFTPGEHALFPSLGGIFIDSLPTLAELTRSASLCIAGDTGPAHLAAQLGIPTIALFGATDPGVWQPVGPSVTVIQSPDGCMQSILPITVLAAAEIAANGIRTGSRD